METSNKILDITDSFRFGLRDSRRFKWDRKGNTVMVKRGMEHSGNRRAAMHKDQLPSSSLSHLLSILLPLCAFASLLSVA